MSKWIIATQHSTCSGCKYPIYPGDTMRYEEEGGWSAPLCQDCGGWPR